MDKRIAVQLRIRGTVQGVGFRPFVYLLATQEGLAGSVLNDGNGVEAVLEGSEQSIARFRERLIAELPPLAHIDSVESATVPVENRDGFIILESRTTQVTTGIPADAAVCEACLQEMCDRHNPRYRYAFINCTHCGPRYTITEHLPYDRPQTSMRYFPMCPDCLKQYKDPLDRRFHAQPIACPTCGPHLSLVDNQGRPIACEDKIAETLRRIKAGQIVAVKGLGGFHLVCDAGNAEAVARLRARKSRPGKPFAIMCANVISARDFLEISPAAEQALRSPKAPIVLCQKKPQADQKLPGIAPGLNSVGLMLPYTPIHWLLFFEEVARTVDKDWYKKPIDLALVMTSANAGGEPLVTDNAEAVEKLSGICDALLIHNRDILIRCDDSVMRDCGLPSLSPIRRARGYTPEPVKLPFDSVSVIATGAWLKNTACLIKGNRAIMTQHIGDLDRTSNCLTLQEAIEHIRRIYEITPNYIACDLHTDFYSTRLAEELADQFQAELVPVQHHHAHIASVMAQHAVTHPVIGLALDGVGLGDDGKAWGGELLRVTSTGFERLAHLTELPLPGGDKCAREGWRIAVALLEEQADTHALSRVLYPSSAADMIRKLCSKPHLITRTSSLGRLFDAAASLLGVADASTYEGEAPALLEACAQGKIGRNHAELVCEIDGHLDFRKLLLYLATQRKAKSQAAADFHTTLAKALSAWAEKACRQTQTETVCLSGGCCLNRLLTSQIRTCLQNSHLQVLESVNVPCNDGGVALGQAWVVAMREHFSS